MLMKYCQMFFSWTAFQGKLTFAGLFAIYIAVLTNDHILLFTQFACLT